LPLVLGLFWGKDIVYMGIKIVTYVFRNFGQ
jgi:hypothetical protein